MPTLLSSENRRQWWLPASCVAVMLWLIAAVLPSPFSTSVEPELTAGVVWQRNLRFVDQPGGDIAVIDIALGREIARFQGEQGFVRGTLRALNRLRQMRGVEPHAPMLLTAHHNGWLILADVTTGEKIHLESFGSTNKAAFERLREADVATTHASKE